MWDPKGKRSVTTADQLFGNHTFGKSWEHGYQPLATLDKNSNGKLSGDELKALALWFDANRDGVSDPGEVKGAIESGVVNIYVTPDRTDPKTGWVHTSKGFDRMVNGKLETLPSVDWFARPYSGAGAAQAAATLSGSGSPTTASNMTAIPTPYNTPAGTPNWKDKVDAARAATKGAGGSSSGGASGGSGGGSGGGSASGGRAQTAQQQSSLPLAISGTWLWAQSPNVPSVDQKIGDGILTIIDAGGGIIEGSSLLELPLEKNPANAAKMIVRVQLKGTFDGRNGNGEETYSFLVVHPETGQVTSTTATLSADGKTLKGKSTTKTDSGVLEYEWTAIRLPEQDKK